MNINLFESFEKRPDECQAVYVSDDNIDRIATYYAQSGYDATVHRDRGNASLTLCRDGVSMSVVPEQCLIYGHPPTAVDVDEFLRVWRVSHERYHERTDS